MISHLVIRSDGYTATVCGHCGTKTVLGTKATNELLDSDPHYIVCTGEDHSSPNPRDLLNGCNKRIRRSNLTPRWNPLRKTA